MADGDLTSAYWSRLLHRPASRRSVLRGVGAGAFAFTAAALLGCTADEPAPGAPSTSTSTAEPSSTPGLSGRPRLGGRLQIAQAGDPTTFDVHQETSPFTSALTQMVYNQLLRVAPLITEETPETLVGDLAREWEVAPDGQTYTFRLEEHVRFHDGATLTAEDVRASLLRQMRPPRRLVNPPRQRQLEAVSRVEMPDDRTVILHLARPVSPLSMLPVLAQSWMAVYSRVNIEVDFQFRRFVNGTGPYRMAVYEPDNRISFDRFTDYFVSDRPHLDGVDVYVITDPGIARSNFRDGALHLFAPESAEDVDRLQRAPHSEHLILQETGAYEFTAVEFGDRAPWNDVRVRQAIATAFDQQGLVDTLGDGRRGGLLSAGGYWALPAADLARIPGYGRGDLAEARALLDAAEVPPELATTLLTGEGDPAEGFASLLAERLAPIGIIAALDVQRPALVADRLRRRAFDLAWSTSAYSLDDPDIVFAEFVAGDAPHTPEPPAPTLERLYAHQSAELDPAARREFVHDLEREALSSYRRIVTHWGIAREMHWDGVKDYAIHPSIFNNRRWDEAFLDL